VLLPASLKSTRQVPTPVKLTLLPLIEQPFEVWSRVMTTWSPEVAVALGVYDPPTLPAAGALLAVMVLAVVPAAEAGDAEIDVKPARTRTDVAPSANAERIERMAPLLFKRFMTYPCFLQLA
jgi:hypothetical protein